MRKLLLYLALCTAAVWSVVPSYADIVGRPHDFSLNNPKGHCLNCHDPHNPKLGQGFSYALKRPNEIQVCYQCHAGALNDYSSIDPSYTNITGLYSYYNIYSEFSQPYTHFPRYGMDGEHYKCSYCHNPHGVFNLNSSARNGSFSLASTAKKPKLLSAGPDAVTDTYEFCLVCHNSDPNPPHRPFPNISVGAQYKFSRTYFSQMKHSTFFRWSTANEPTPDTANTYDDNPYGKGKDISCLVCHRPHGSPNNYMLKAPDDQNFCLTCHGQPVVNGIEMDVLSSFNTTGHGKPGAGRICQDCHSPHGTGQKNAIKTTIIDPHTGAGNAVNVTANGVDDACFACHGLASADKYYSGKIAYNASIHKTSPSARNFVNVSGAQPGDCVNCHNPHGKGNAKMLVSPDDQTMCFDCHNSVTPDVPAAFQSASHHDLTKVRCVNCHNVHTVTASSVMMNPFKPQSTITDNKTFCLKCHSGTMPQGVTGAPNVFAEWSGGGHNVSQVLSCSDCHNPHGSPNPYNLNYAPEAYGGYTANFSTGISFDSRQLCEACHNRTGFGYKGANQIPTGTGYVAEHDQTDTTPCSHCHSKPHDPALWNYTGSSGYFSVACLNCHTQYTPGTNTPTGNPYPVVDAEFNTPTNPIDADTRKSTHPLTYNPYSSVPSVDCVKCHGANHNMHNATSMVIDPDPSNPRPGSLNIRQSAKFCLQCHDSTPRKLGNYSSPLNIMDTWTSAGHGMPSANLVCDKCHEHHGSVNRKLIKTVINGSQVLSNYSGDNASVCAACHAATNADLPMWPGFSVFTGSIHSFGNLTTGNLVSDGSHGPGACVNCHNPHGSRVAGSNVPTMLYKKEEQLCYRCHASGFDNFSTPGDYNDKWDRFGSFLRIMKESDAAQAGGNKMALHLGQTGGQSIPPNTAFNEGLLSSKAFPDNDAVITVKVRIPVLNQASGYVRPAGVSIEGAANSPMPWTAAVPPYVLCTYNGGSWVVWANGVYVNKVTGFGNEATTYHTVKLVRNRGQQNVSVYIDDGQGNYTLIGTATLATSGYFKVRLYAFGGTGGSADSVEAWFDDFNVQYISGGSAHDTSSGDDVQARFYMKSHHKISDADQTDGSKVECFDCHDPHTITEKKMVYNNFSGRITPIVADQNFCLKCHNPNPPQGVRFPAPPPGVVWDKTLFDQSAHGNPLRRYKTLQPGQAFSNYSNGVVYSCKVCHNPHGSNQVAMERESWDINRDGLPDDIDGDGVLDSSNMVGFIGYSTGTRKVMLVDTIAGIPSRATFKRVSTTIPVQANGSIDIMLCLNCHDGTPAPDVKSSFMKLSHHDVTFADQTSHGGSKIECYNCHDQHRAQARNDAAGEYPTTNPTSNREPMPGDAAFCLKCHDTDNGNPPPGVSGVSFGKLKLKNIKLSYNPQNLRYYPPGCEDPNGYDLITTFSGHYVQSTGKAIMCRTCHNQHGSNYPKMLRDDTEPSKPGYDASQPIQNMRPVALDPSDKFSGGDSAPLSATPERCLACHSGGTTYDGNLIPIPPPPGAAFLGFTSLPEVAKHPDIKSGMSVGSGLTMVNGHLYSNSFAVSTSVGSVKDVCTLCHDSHNPYIPTEDGELLDCFKCHNINTSLPDVQTEFNANPLNPTRSKSYHPIKYDPSSPVGVECRKCHDQAKHMQGRVRLRKDPSSSIVGGRFVDYTSDADVWTSQPTDGGFVTDSAAPFTNNSSISRFCLECHGRSSTVASSFNGTDAGGVTGTHNPQALPFGIMSGAHFTNGKLVCTNCHEYHGSVNTTLKKNSFATKTEPTPSTQTQSLEGAAFCYGCHNNPANSKDGINVFAQFSGTASHHKVGAAEQAASGAKVDCTNCHNPHVVTRAKAVVMADNSTVAAAAGSAFCVGCHSSPGAAGVKFPGYSTGTTAPEWDTATGRWNRWNKGAFMNSTTSAHLRGGLSCMSCHNPHGSSNYALLLQNISTTSGISVSFGVHSTVRGKRTEEIGVNGVCAACHKSAMGVYNGYSSFNGQTFGKSHGVDKNCTYCHNPHSTSQWKRFQNDTTSGARFMMRGNRPLYMNMTSPNYGSVYDFKGFQNSTTGAPFYMFCSSAGCHASEKSAYNTFNMDLPVDTYNKYATSSSHHPIKEGVLTCNSCHKEHGSPNSPDLRAPYFRSSNWPKLWHSGVGVYGATPGYELGPHGSRGNQAGTSNFNGSDYFEESNYAAKGISGYLPDATHRKQVMAGFENVSTPDNANDLCFMCHQKDDIIGTVFTGMTGTNTRFLGHEAVKGGARMSHQISSRTPIPANGEYHDFSCSACHFPHATTQNRLVKVSCFSQADGENTNYVGRNGYATVNNCHAYTKNSNNLGWRNLTTVAKSDFARPHNPVTDLAAASNANLDVALSWTAVTDDQTGQGADHYNVYRSSQYITQATKPYATRIYKGVPGGAAGSGVSWTDYTGQPNTAYYYAVVACDAQDNESFVSNCASISLGADTVPPNTITTQQLTQVAGTLNVYISWNNPGDNVNVTGYNIYRKAASSLTDSVTAGDIAGGTASLMKTMTTAYRSASGDGSADPTLYNYTDADASLTINSYYAYAVVAFDAAGNVAPVPTGQTFAVQVVDPPPAAVTTLAAALPTASMNAQLSWSAPSDVGSIDHYNIYRNASPITQSDIGNAGLVVGSVSGASTAYTDSVPSTGAAYYYAVTAVDSSSGKESALGNVVSVTIPAPPSGFTAYNTLFNVRTGPLNGAQLNWSAPAYTTGLKWYNVYWRRNGGTWTQAALADNLAVNGGMENNLNGWSAPSGLTASSDGTMPHGGSASARLTATSAGDHYLQTNSYISVLPSRQYTYSGWVYVPQALTGGTTELRVIEWTSGGAYVTEHRIAGVTVTSGWQKMTDTWTTNASTTQISLRLQVDGVGTAYWDDIALTPTVALSTNARLDFTGLEPGSYDTCVTAVYSSYGGTAPYESVMSGSVNLNLTDSSGPASPQVTAALAPDLNHADLSWSAPSDGNYSGYAPTGVDHYQFASSYDGLTWKTVIYSSLANPGFESFSGTADDGNTDSFTGWTASNASIYAVSDALFDTYAAQITSPGVGYISAAETGSQPVASRTYALSFWAKASKPTSFGYSIKENGGTGTSVGGVSNQPIGTTWQRFATSGTFSSSATASSAAAVINASTDSTARITIDGVRLSSGNTDALSPDDGTFYQPSGYNSPGAAQSFNDTVILPPGGSGMYRMQAVDAQGNYSAPAFAAVSAKPSAINDLSATGSTTASANVLSFSPAASTAGLSAYDVYAKEQATALGTSDIIPANKIGSFAPTSTAGNEAHSATASANATYSYSPSNVNDGNTNSYWGGNPGTTPDYIALAFPSPVAMLKVSFVFYPNYTYYNPSNYLVQTSNDGVNWTTQVTVTNNTSSTPAYTFPQAVIASQVRLYITNTSGGMASYFPIVSEFMVYPGESYTHGAQNSVLPALAGHTYSYAVIARDVNGLTSDISSGPVTVSTVPDLDAPLKITDLAASSAYGSSQAVLTWSTPFDNTGATAYEIYRSPADTLNTATPITDGNFNTSAATLLSSGNYANQAGAVNTYTDLSWYVNQPAYYAVRSRDAAGNWSPISNSPYIVVGADVVPPTPPTVTSCTPVASPEIDVHWTPATDNVQVSGYQLFRADASDPNFANGIDENNIGLATMVYSAITYNNDQGSPRTVQSDTSGTPGKTYYYAMRAYDPTGNHSNISNSVAATVATQATDTTPPSWNGSAPLTVTPEPYPDMDLNWTAASDLDNSGGSGVIDHYDVYRSSASFSTTTDAGVSRIASVSGQSTSYIDNTGDTGTYYYGIVAVDASVNHNQSVLSNIVSGTYEPKPSPDNTPPTVPGSLAAPTGIYPMVNLSWTASTDKDDAGNPRPLNYYKLYRSVYPLDITDANKSNASEVRTTIIANDAVSYSDSGSSGVVYNYRLEAFDLAGNASGLSSEVAGTVAPAPCADTTPPPAPASLSAIVGPSPDMDFSWTASADTGCTGVTAIDHFNLYRSTSPITATTDLRTVTSILVQGNNAWTNGQANLAYTDASGMPNTTYWYVLTAVDAAGNESGMSNIITGMTAADTMAPAAITNLKAAPATGMIQLTWCKPSDNVGIDHYDIYRKAQSAILQDADVTASSPNKIATFTNTGTCLSYNDTTVASGTTYSYAVIAVDAAGNRSTISSGQQPGDTIASMP